MSNESKPKQRRDILDDEIILDALFPDSGWNNLDDTTYRIIRGLYFEATNRVSHEELFGEVKAGYSDLMCMLDKLGMRQSFEPGSIKKVKELLPNFAARSKEGRDRLFALVDSGVVHSENIDLFLSLEFGSDFGDTVLTIAEKINTNNEHLVQEVFKILENIYKNLDSLQEHFMSHIDAKWSSEVRKGISTRTSEILLEFNHRLDSNNPRALGVVLVALNSILEWTSGARKMLVESRPILVDGTDGTMLFHFIHPEDGLLPGAVECSAYGKHTKDMSDKERGLREGRGARFSITYDEQDRDAALSLEGAGRRLALNGRFDKSSTNNHRLVDPDAESAEVSFDIFSHHGSIRSRKTADLISEGRERRSGNKGAYTYDLIDQSWGQREIFADLIIKIQDYLIQKSMESRDIIIGKDVVELV